jgi:hypothetical protein
MSLLETIADELIPILCRSTVPLFLLDEKQDLDSVASGVLLRIGERPFVVTAAHVLYRRESLELNLATADLYENKRAIPLEGESRRLKHCEADDSPAKFDVGAVLLTDACLQTLGRFRFLELADLDLQVNVATGWHFVHGFPVDGLLVDDKQVVRAHYTHSAELHMATGDELPGFDSSVHVAVKIDRTTLVTPSGAPATAPSSLRGVSGGAIWRAASSSELPTAPHGV